MNETRHVDAVPQRSLAMVQFRSSATLGDAIFTITKGVLGCTSQRSRGTQPQRMADLVLTSCIYDLTLGMHLRAHTSRAFVSSH
jgi:hypothetical protein